MSEAPSTSWAIWAWQAYRDGRLVEADTVQAQIDAATPPVSTNASLARWAWDGDINEAKNLHDALLPGVSVKIFGTSDNEWRVQISGTDAVWGPDPARAWLLAILKAKQAEGRG